MFVQPSTRIALWPPDDTEESVLGIPLHQTTITSTRSGLNEAATVGVPEGEPPRWQTGGQTTITGFARPDRSSYRVLPDVFVYHRPFDERRSSLGLGRDEPPALIVEVLSEATADSDLDLARGKGYSYARAGVAEYLTLDPTGDFLGGAQGRGWRLEGGVYVPWERDACGRWVSAQVGAALGFEGVHVVVFGGGWTPHPARGADPARGGGRSDARTGRRHGTRTSRGRGGGARTGTGRNGEGAAAPGAGETLRPASRRG